MDRRAPSDLNHRSGTHAMWFPRCKCDLSFIFGTKLLSNH
jgi:hypothetical protein